MLCSELSMSPLSQGEPEQDKKIYTLCFNVQGRNRETGIRNGNKRNENERKGGVILG